MKIGPGPGDGLYLDQCYGHVFGCGQTGSAKTTGFAAILERALLAHPERPMFLFMCQKPDDADRAIRFATAAGRRSDVIHVRLDGPERFNILDQELSAVGGGTERAGMLIDVLLEVANRNRKNTSSDSYWPESSGRQMRHALTLVKMGTGKCSFDDVQEFCQSLPGSEAELKDPDLAKKSFAARCVVLAEEKHKQERAFQMAARFVCDEWPRLSDRTRSVIQSVTTNTLDRFLTGKFAGLICEDSTFNLEQAIDEGKIVLLDLPGAVYGLPAIWVQVAFKVAFLNTVLRRDLTRYCRPAVLWADEAANFCVPAIDAMVLSQARQFKLACINIVQNLPLVYTALGNGEPARQQALAWFSNHATIFAAANSDEETNKLISGLCGERKEVIDGGSIQKAVSYDLVKDLLGHAQGGANANWSEIYRPALPPYLFPTLRKGGRANGYVMEAIVFQSGRRFSNGKTWIKGSFRQEF